MYSILIETNITPTKESLHDIGIQLYNGFSKGLSPFSWSIIENPVDPIDLEDKNEELKEENESLKDTNSNLKDTIDKQTDTINDLKDTIEKLREQILILQTNDNQ